MKPKALIRDPVFQLNLLLWMAKEQPQDHWRVRPLFWEAGFAVMYVEQPFRFPVETSRAIEDSGLAVSKIPEPELLLRRAANSKALYFEAKANSFSPASSNCNQARGHLIAVGPAFGETYPSLSALLCYVLPTPTRSRMAKCLGQLVGELKKVGLAPGSYSLHGLSVHRGSVIYRWDAAFSDYTGVNGQSAVILKGLSEDTDPSPLILVYTDEDCPTPELQSFYRRAMLDQVRARLVCDLHATEAVGTYQVTVRDLLARTTEGVFEYLAHKRQNSLRSLVRTNMLVPICERWRDKQPGCVTLTDDTFTIRWTDEDAKQQFLDWLEDRATRFPEEKPSEKGPTLFPVDAPQDSGSVPKEE